MTAFLRPFATSAVAAAAVVSEAFAVPSVRVVTAVADVSDGV